MSTIGVALKEARTKKSVSLEEVHAKIKIHPRVLQLLEEDKFDKLPSPLFVKSFLRSYAEYLEINSEDLIHHYEKEGKKEPEQVLFIRSADEKMELLGAKSHSLKFPVLIGACILVAVGLAVWTATELQKPPKSSAKKVAAKSTKTQKAVASAAPKQEAAVKKPSEWLRSPDQANFPVLNKKTPLRLAIQAQDSVWLRITADGKVLFQGILKKGASESWEGKSFIEVWTGNAANMALSLNDYALGSPGKGTAKKLLITHSGVKQGPSEARAVS